MIVPRREFSTLSLDVDSLRARNARLCDETEVFGAEVDSGFWRSALVRFSSREALQDSMNAPLISVPGFSVSRYVVESLAKKDGITDAIEKSLWITWPRPDLLNM
ncbi:hypothetical protein Tco_0369595 [Tanacetum coccineum]